MVTIKVPDRGSTTFDTEHEFIRQIAGMSESVCLDLGNVKEVHARVLAFIAHYGKVKRSIVFRNVSPEFRDEYGKIIGTALGTNFDNLIEGRQ